MKDKGEDPPALRSKPTMLPGLDFYVTTHHRMTGERDYADGGVPLPLRIGTIKQYFDAYHLGSCMPFWFFLEKIQAVDTASQSAMLAQRQKKDSQRASQDVGRKAKGPRRR